jgi:hypothetical protein
MRLYAVWLLTLASCAAPSARYERSLRAWVLDPVAARPARATDLAAMADQADVRSGVRVAAVHHALALGREVDAEQRLDVEAALFPVAARFLATYRRLMGLPERVPPQRDGGVTCVIVVERTGQREVVADFLATVERPLRARGWYVVPVEIGADVLAMVGGDAARLVDGVAEPAGLRRLAECGIDACLFVDIAEFWLHEAMVVEVVRYEVEYTMFATASGQQLWRRAAIGDFERREPITAFPSDDDKFFYPSSLGAAFSDPNDFVRALNTGILRTVPPP